MNIDADGRATGTISVHSRGFGFLNEAGNSAFVTPPDLNPFLAGDVVSAKITESEGGRFSARDVKLVKRQRTVLFGEVVRRKGRCWLKTDSEVANTDWPLEGNAKQGSYVLAQVEGDKAHLVDILPDDADIPLERLIARYDLVEEFDEECYRQVESIKKAKHSLGNRRDLRDITTVTIDAPSTTDLDDAVSVLPADSEGAVRLLVSIADPAAFIPRRSALDEEARARGTSTYLTDRVLPMLPHELSSGHLSLHPGKDRCCLTVEMRIDIEGDIRSVDVYESLIRSRTRLSYTELAAWLKKGKMTDNLAKVKDMLGWLRTTSARLSVARGRRGGVRLSDDNEALALLDDEGNVVGTKPQRTNVAHTVIERFMVAANEAVAGWLEDRGFPALYRVHPEPDEESVDLLTSSAREFGFELGFRGQLTPKALAVFDLQIRGDRNEAAIRSVLRGTLEKARYTMTPGTHLGLGAPLYLHFTSPLRRYADFAVHRLIKAYLGGERDLQPEAPEYQELCLHLNHRAMLAGKAEAFRRRMLLAEYMVDQVGEEFEARVTRILPFGLVAQLEESLVEGLLPLDSLPGGPWVVTTTSVKAKNDEIVLGSALRVKLVSAEPELGQLEYALVRD